jgi:transcriptional regulator EpsA
MSAIDLDTARALPAGSSPVLRLTEGEAKSFLRIASDSQGIRRHYDLFVWLTGEVQKILAHEVLIAASGDFATWQMKLDIVSALPGVRTARLTSCSIDEMVEGLHARWLAGDRRPVIFGAAESRSRVGDCTCPLHTALRGMQTLLVHGVRDSRDGYDSIYLAFGRHPFVEEPSKDRFLFLLDLFISQIDLAFRRVPPFSLITMKGHSHGGSDALDLSAREQEILDWICRGKTNVDIAAALDISPFTVKNHLQRIFKKIGVSNRTQAATKYNQALRELRNLISR